MQWEIRPACPQRNLPTNVRVLSIEGADELLLGAPVQCRDVDTLRNTPVEAPATHELIEERYRQGGKQWGAR